MNILGISAFYHDSAACLVQDGKIVSAVQEERFTRKKHDSSFPTNSIGYCLSNSGLKIEDVDYVAFYEKPLKKFGRLLDTYMQFAPGGLESFLRSMPVWIKEKIWLRNSISTELNYDGKIIFPEHHESHASSAFFPSPFREAAFLTMDGVGEWTTASFGVGCGNKVEIYADINFPHSLGLLYSAITYFTGFKVNSDEYKVMGLAPYGKPRYKDLILSELITVNEDGSFHMNMKYFNYCTGLTMTSRKFDNLFGGPPRKPESLITRREMDLARSVQEVTEEIVMKMARHVHRKTGQKNLCMAGGVALNCVANGKLLREGPFEEVWIQPAAGDAGGALGAALFVWYHYLDNNRESAGGRDMQFGSYLGPGYSDEEIGSFLSENNIVYDKMDSGALVDTVADLIADGKVVGWFQGRMEFGPRALGSRSIIGDARNPQMQEIMNKKIKFREGFRPFAPAVLYERVSEYFELDRESPYMLLVAPVKREIRKEFQDADSGDLMERLKIRRSEIPAVTHVDLSARIQTVTEKNGLFYDLIKAFDRKHGCPVVINTSFNIRGEPIVCTPRDAYRCFVKTNIDCLVMGHYIIDKQRHTPTWKDLALSQTG